MMRLKIQPKLEDPLKAQVETILTKAVSPKARARINSLNFPKEFIEELEDFASRNAIPVEKKNGKQESYYCPRCLKAHALSLAGLMKLDKPSIKFLESNLKGEVGHNSYYLDQERVIKLD